MYNNKDKVTSIKTKWQEEHGNRLEDEGPELPKKISGPDDIGKPRGIPAGCYSVFQCSLPTWFPCRRKQTRHSEPEFTHFASGDFIVIHSGARFMWRCVDTQRIKCRRFARDWPWEASSFIRDSTRSSSKIYMDLPSISRKRAKVRTVFAEAPVGVK